MTDAPTTSTPPVREPGSPERAGPSLERPGPSLEREVSLPLLVLYGLGTTVGAGIYALTGEVAGEAGMRAPLAFVVAALLAGITGLGFAELAGRMPKAAGEAVFVDRAFGRRSFTTAIGLAVMTAGIVAAAAITNAFGGYVSELLDVPRAPLVLTLLVVLTGVAAIGAKESVGVAAVFTAIELGGLALVLWTARDVVDEVPGAIGDLIGPPTTISAWAGVLGGAFLAFFAFLGFEDIDSVAEETEEAHVALPRAIVWTLAITTVLYLTVAAVAVLVVDPAELGGSDAPLALVHERAGGSAAVLTAIAALAMVNGALVQLVMVPRVVYGLARLGLVPEAAGAVSPRTHTPLRATFAAAAVVAVLALGLDLGPLARITSATTMGVFVAVNVALLVVKAKDGPIDGFSVPRALPVLGIAVSGAMFLAEGWRLVGG